MFVGIYRHYVLFKLLYLVLILSAGDAFELEKGTDMFIDCNDTDVLCAECRCSIDKQLFDVQLFEAVLHQDPTYRWLQPDGEGQPFTRHIELELFYWTHFNLLSRPKRHSYVGSADNNVYALDAKTGTKVWSYMAGNGVNSSPIVAYAIG